MGTDPIPSPAPSGGVSPARLKEGLPGLVCLGSGLALSFVGDVWPAGEIFGMILVVVGGLLFVVLAIPDLRQQLLAFLARFTVALGALGVCLSLLSVPAEPAGPIPATGTVEVYFSPKGGATEAIIREIASSKSQILVQAYSFTSAPIAKALVGTHKRGVKIEVILDKSQRSERYTSATSPTLVSPPTLTANTRSPTTKSSWSTGRRSLPAHSISPKPPRSETPRIYC